LYKIKDTTKGPSGKSEGFFYNINRNSKYMLQPALGNYFFYYFSYFFYAKKQGTRLQ